MLDLGVVKPGSTIRIPYDTFAGSTGASATQTGFAASDVQIYKDGGTTQRASSAGITATTDFDTSTGLQVITIDLSDNTTADFYAAGSEYLVAIADVTVDSQTVRFWAARFRIGYPDAILDTTIATLSSQTSFTLAAGSADNSAYVGCPCVIHDAASSVQVEIGFISAYTGSTKTVTLAADPGVFAIAAKDNISIFLPSNVRAFGTTVVTPRDIGASVLLSSGTGTGQISLSSGLVTLAGVTHTGAVIPTVTTTTTATNLTNLPSIPANWITAAGITAAALNGKGDWNVGKTGYSLTPTTGLGNQTANITGTITTTTNLTNERAKYMHGAVWIGPVANTNTVSYTDGIMTNPVSTVAAAKTIADNLGLKRFWVQAGVTVTMGADYAGYVFTGINWILATTGARSVSGTVIDGAIGVTGSYTGASAPYWKNCEFGATVTLPASNFEHCEFIGTQTLGTGNYDFIDCASVVAGTSTPIFDCASPISAQNISFRRWSGGITLNNINSNTTVSIDMVSGGTVTLNGADGNVQVRGMAANVVDNRTGAPTLGRNAVINQTYIATPTNITAGTITTVTNLTNAPTAGDFTATMKASIGTAVAASAVASVTGNVGGNVTGSVGSVATGGITTGSFAAGAINAAAIAADAIGASELAADAVTEIATGVWAATTRQLTSAQIFNLSGDITGNLSGSVGSVTGNVGGNVTGNVGGNVQGSVGAIAANGIAGNSFATGAITAAALAADAVTTLVHGVWDEVLSGHLGAGSTGAALNSAGTAAGVDTAGTTTLLARLSSARAGYLDNLSAGAVALASGVTVASGGITSASLAASSITATTIASSALNGKGDWLLSSGYTVPPTTTQIVNATADLFGTRGTTQAGSTATLIVGDSGLSSSDSFYNGCVLLFTSGSLDGQTRKVTGYTGSSRTFDVSPKPFTSSPSTNDTFVVLGRID